MKELASGMALGLLVIALVGSGVGISAYSASNAATGSAIRPTHMAQCETMNGACNPDHATCAQDMRDETHTGCDTMGMTAEQCQTMHDPVSAGDMSGDMMSGSCH